IKYYLNDYEILNLEGHRGVKIGADILDTFLPEEVVSSLYTAVEKAGLYVSNLTLEPIAAINVAIPENFRLLNIALLDVGAGTSDICITRDGSIIGYGMIPSAGDELTETLIKKYLIDFDTAEMLKMVSPKKKSVTYKDIMGISHKITPDEIFKTLASVKDEITKKIADKIIELNGGMPVSAVFVVGGGGKLDGFTDVLARMLKLPEERVALRGQEVMHNINFLVENIKKDPLYVTPIGICLNYFDQKNNFIFVTVNGDRVKLYNNDKLTIFDAAVQYGLPNEHIFPIRGEDLTFKINGKNRIVRGFNGEAAVIKRNDNIVGMNALIEANDKIDIIKSTSGEPASAILGTLPEYDGTLDFIVNGNKITCPKFAVVNGNPETESYEIQDGDEIEMKNYYLLDQLLTFMDVKPEGKIFVNNKEALLDEKVYENFVVSWSDEVKYEDLPEATEADKEKMKEKETPENVETQKNNVADNDAGLASLHVIINNVPYTLTGKNEYRFVDAMDACAFDMSSMKGSRLETKVDGAHAEFIDLIHEGANIEIYWEK
ncbi:MAG: rod shape-determining protein, partial [Lachnospiraceae bacterium]|nr:rod shape-determining protein [Lachnospiraceae bacterium]